MENSLKQLLRENNVSLKKAYGQNFLTDVELLRNIVKKAGVTKDDTALEIGCGAGALTAVLCENAKKVVGYEIDTSLKPVLEKTLADYDNVSVVFKDVMKEKIATVEEKLGGSYVLVANLPYYVTTPIVMKFLENSKTLKAMVIMVQEEVALRFSAKAGSSDYGAITVGINLRGSAEIIEYVGREKFTPAPNVDSAVVKIVLDGQKFKGVNLENVRNVVRIGFSSRRKMLVNNLMNFYKMSRGQAEEIMRRASIPIDVRGEKLTAEDYARLSDIIYEDKGNKNGK